MHSPCPDFILGLPVDTPATRCFKRGRYLQPYFFLAAFCRFVPHTSQSSYTGLKGICSNPICLCDLLCLCCSCWCGCCCRCGAALAADWHSGAEGSFHTAQTHGAVACVGRAAAWAVLFLTGEGLWGMWYVQEWRMQYIRISWRVLCFNRCQQTSWRSDADFCSLVSES